MDASDWVTVIVAALGIVGTLSATVIAHVLESKRAARLHAIEAVRTAAERADSTARERRDAIRSDYREVLRFVALTRGFVTEMRRRLEELPGWTATLSSDAREVEDLEARAELFRRRMLTELPDMQALVGVWGPQPLIGLFDDLAGFGPKVAASVSVGINFKYRNERFPAALDEAGGALDDVLALLERARELVQTELAPDDSSGAADAEPTLARPAALGTRAVPTAATDDAPASS